MDADLKHDELPDDIGGALRRLDDDAARRAASVDPARVAARVLRRLQDEPAVTVTPIRPRLRVPVSVRIAAAAVLLVTGGVLGRQMLGRPHGPASASELSWLAMPESLDQAQASALIAAMDSVPVTVDSVLPAVGATVEDLNEQELQALLLTMDQEGSL
jgi:hypothetical protein